MKFFTSMVIGIACASAAIAAETQELNNPSALSQDEAGCKEWRGRNSSVKILPSGSQDGKCAIEITSDKNLLIYRRIPVKPYQGKWVVFSGKMKADNIAASKLHYLGAKFMINSSEGRVIRSGTYDWRPVCSTAFLPADAKELILRIGIQSSTGKASYSDMELAAYDQPAGDNFLPPVKVMEAMMCGHGAFLADGGPDKTYCLSFINKGAEWNEINIPLPVKKIRGHKIVFSGKLKGESIKLENYWGAFFKISCRDAKGKSKDFNAKYAHKTDFDWIELEKEVQIPNDAASVYAVIGLYNVPGTAKFADLSVKLDD